MSLREILSYWRLVAREARKTLFVAYGDALALVIAALFAIQDVREKWATLAEHDRTPAKLGALVMSFSPPVWIALAVALLLFLTVPAQVHRKQEDDIQRERQARRRVEKKLAMRVNRLHLEQEIAHLVSDGTNLALEIRADGIGLSSAWGGSRGEDRAATQLD